MQYTTDKKAEERDWFVEAVVGDVTTAGINNLTPDMKYYFKMSARNNKGYGPPGPVVNYVTTKGKFIIRFSLVLYFLNFDQHWFHFHFYVHTHNSKTNRSIN